MTSPRDNETTLRDELARLERTGHDINHVALTARVPPRQARALADGDSFLVGSETVKRLALSIRITPDTLTEFRIATIIDYLSRYPTACAELFLESLTPTEQEAVNPANFGVKAIHLAVSSLLSEQEMTMPELADGIDMTPSELSQALKRYTLSLEVLESIAQGLGVTQNIRRIPPRADRGVAPVARIGRMRCLTISKLRRVSPPTLRGALADSLTRAAWMRAT